MYKSLIKRYNQLRSIFKGYCYKFKIDIKGIEHLPSIVCKSSHPRTIVTLTSYGRRVKDVVYYTLVSLLEQDMLPDKIILWLDSDNWSSDNLPIKLKSLQRKGISIRFCEDIKSYKKLIPALEEYPDDILITVDDDMIYHHSFLSKLIYEHNKHPKDIICNLCRFPNKDKNGNLTSYNDWINETVGCYYMPIGSWGILYPPHSLHKDVLDRTLFFKLSPTADDIWFWIMGLRVNSSYRVTKHRVLLAYNFDDLYQFLHKGSALTQDNRKNFQNDIQLKNILDYYSIDL